MGTVNEAEYALRRIPINLREAFIAMGSPSVEQRAEAGRVIAASASREELTLVRALLDDDMTVILDTAEALTLRNDVDGACYVLEASAAARSSGDEQVYRSLVEDLQRHYARSNIPVDALMRAVGAARPELARAASQVLDALGSTVDPALRRAGSGSRRMDKQRGASWRDRWRKAT